MSSPTPNLIPLLNRLRRRLALIRFTESLALCLLTATLLATAVVPALMIAHQSARPLTPAAALLALFAASTWSLTHPPTLADAAALADAELALHNLLATALATTNPADPWHQSVLALADHRARSIDPAALLLTRLSPRVWTAVSLSATLLLTLAALTTPSTPATASPPSANSLPRALDPDSNPASSHAPPLTTEHDRPYPTATDRHLDDPNASSMDTTTIGDPASNHHPAQSTSVTAGPGFTPDHTPSTPPPPPASNSLSRVESSDGRSLFGGASASNSPHTQDASSSSSPRGQSTPAAALAPWSSPTWPTDQSAANSALHANHVPPAARDLVREYFAPAPPDSAAPAHP